MMSEYFDHYHRWEPLAEFHFNLDDNESDLLYCLCSRVFLRDGRKTYYVEKDADASESDVDVLRDSQSQECDDHSHVHFSLDTSYKVKCEKDEGASCYCSASHTDNYCSTDEHDPAQALGTASHALQPSDSGADLTYQDCHSDYTTHDYLDKTYRDFPPQTTTELNENYLSEDNWEKFWAVNGERIIWASWIKKYSDYINPAYLGENQELVMDENNIPKQLSADQIYDKDKVELTNVNDAYIIRERKFSYDSKVNPYKKHHNETVEEKGDKNTESNRVESWMPLGRKRSCSEHDRILSPRTVAGTDSMTNVTKITLSSYDVTSSHVTSESSPTEDYSVSSSTSDDQSNDQTRIVNPSESIDQVPSDELDTEEYWQFLWKKHFGEQYALHYESYMSMKKDLPAINVEIVTEVTEIIEDKVIDIECENSEGNSQEMPTVIEHVTEIKEVEIKVDKIKLDEKENKSKKKSKKPKKESNNYLQSVGVLLQTLFMEEQRKSEMSEVVEAGEGSGDRVEPVEIQSVDDTSMVETDVQPVTNSNFIPYNHNDGDDDPPEEKPVSLKRSHERDEDEVASEEINSTFETMGFCLNQDNMPHGQLVYRKRLARLRPPRSKRFGMARKTYFDDEGNAQPQESQDEREMQTDEDCVEKSGSEKANNIQVPVVESEEPTNRPKDEETNSKDILLEAAEVDLPPDVDTLCDVLDCNEEHNSTNDNLALGKDNTANAAGSTKRKRRNKRNSRNDKVNVSRMPEELKDDPKMYKYWKKRHSLFHRFDEGIKLDRESWFSVTPENVASHIAEKFAYDVVLDGFCGAGGNTIQFARTCEKVIAIDIDPVKVEMARHNATVYGVADRIEFIVGDFFKLAPTIEADMVFLSPPWGGPKYSENYEYDIETMLEPKSASELMEAACAVSTNIALYLPRNTKTDQLLSLAQEIGGSLEIEQSYLDRRFVGITAYFYYDS